MKHSVGIWFFSWGFALMLFGTHSSCKNPNSEWEFYREIQLMDVGISGIEYEEETDVFWVSDGDNNRLLRIDRNGEIVEEVDVFRRPMHLSYRDGILYVAEFGADRAVFVSGEDRIAIPLPQHPDSPAGVDVKGDRMAVSDFYGHRIILISDHQDRTFGREGTGPGEFNHPTQVRFFGERLYVADAYNNRIQVFNEENDQVLSLGEEEGIKGVIGLFVDEEYIIATDFENHRILLYSREGELKQILEGRLQNPTSVIRNGNELFAGNHGSQSIVVFKRR